MSSPMNRKNTNIRRIMADVKELEKHPSSRYSASPLEDNMFEWHFTIRGPDGSDFEGGLYHGRILLPSDYPFKPPNIVFMNPNGRFEIGTKICLSISAHHEESWQPAWGIRTMLEAIISFLPSPGSGAIGALDWSRDERQKAAKRSQKFCCALCGDIHELVSEPTEEEGEGEDEENEKEEKEKSKTKAPVFSFGVAAIEGIEGEGGEDIGEAREDVSRIERIEGSAFYQQKEKEKMSRDLEDLKDLESQGKISPPPLQLSLPGADRGDHSNRDTNSKLKMDANNYADAVGDDVPLTPRKVVPADPVDTATTRKSDNNGKAPPPSWESETPPSVRAVRKRILGSRPAVSDSITATTAATTTTTASASAIAIADGGREGSNVNVRGVEGSTVTGTTSPSLSTAHTASKAPAATAVAGATSLLPSSPSSSSSSRGATSERFTGGDRSNSNNSYISAGTGARTGTGDRARTPADVDAAIRNLYLSCPCTGPCTCVERMRPPAGIAIGVGQPPAPAHVNPPPGGNGTGTGIRINMEEINYDGNRHIVQWDNKDRNSFVYSGLFNPPAGPALPYDYVDLSILIVLWMLLGTLMIMFTLHLVRMAEDS